MSSYRINGVQQLCNMQLIKAQCRISFLIKKKCLFGGSNLWIQLSWQHWKVAKLSAYPMCQLIRHLISVFTCGAKHMHLGKGYIFSFTKGLSAYPEFHQLNKNFVSLTVDLCSRDSVLVKRIRIQIVSLSSVSLS